MALEGKSHLPHLFNDNKPSQMRPSAFDAVANYIYDNDCTVSEDIISISEKIDGATILVGYDGRLFFERFGFDERIYKENAQGISLLYFDIFDKPDFIDFVDTLRKEYNQSLIKIQIEMVLVARSRDSDAIRINLVPYKKEAFGSDGGCFVVSVMGADLQKLPSQETLIDAICALIDSPTFITKPMSATTIHYKPFDTSDIIAPYIANPTKENARIAQEQLQNRFLDEIPDSSYSVFYEGLVAICKGIDFAFKMTSREFKKAFAEHNAKKKTGAAAPDLNNLQTGLNKIDVNGKDILVGKIGPDTELVGLLFGHFAPFTGPKGHGRMISAFREKGCNKFLIGIPRSGKSFDDDREMYTTEQRAEICDEYLKQEGLEGKAVILKTGMPAITVKGLIWEAYNMFGPKIRPVYIVGPDRADLFSKNKDFDTDPTTTFPEKMVLTDRGEGAVSGTKVRELIRKGDVDGIAEMTGYSKQIAQKLVDLREDNLEEN